MMKVVKNLLVFGVGVVTGALTLGTMIAYVDDTYKDIIYENDEIEVNAITSKLIDNSKWAVVHYKNK